MGDVLALMFVSVVMLICGIVLVIISSEIWRKIGFAGVVVGLILLIACIIYYPHAHDHYDYYSGNYSTGS